MAPRAYWKGYLRLSLVSCPIALYPATSEREKVSLDQIDRKTGHHVRYRKVDEQTGEEVAWTRSSKATKSPRANTLRSRTTNCSPSRLKAQRR